MRRAPVPRGRGLVRSAPSARSADSEAGDLLGQTRLAVGGLVLVDDALAGGLVEGLAGDLERGAGSLCVPRGDGGADAPNGRLQGGLDRDVALPRLLVGLDPLDLG